MIGSLPFSSLFSAKENTWGSPSYRLSGGSFHAFLAPYGGMTGIAAVQSLTMCLG